MIFPTKSSLVIIFLVIITYSDKGYATFDEHACNLILKSYFPSNSVYDNYVDMCKNHTFYGLEVEYDLLLTGTKKIDGVEVDKVPNKSVLVDYFDHLLYYSVFRFEKGYKIIDIERRPNFYCRKEYPNQVIACVETLRKLEVPHQDETTDESLVMDEKTKYSTEICDHLFVNWSVDILTAEILFQGKEEVVVNGETYKLDIKYALKYFEFHLNVLLKLDKSSLTTIPDYCALPEHKKEDIPKENAEPSHNDNVDNQTHTQDQSNNENNIPQNGGDANDGKM